MADQAASSRGFIREGLRELGRKYARSKLRRETRRLDRARQRALIALGQRAWQGQIGLTPADRQNLGQLEGHAGALAATLAGLESEQARLEAHRANEIAGRGNERLAVEATKQPVDAALRAANARNIDGTAAAEVARLTQDSERHRRELERIDAAQRAAVAELDGYLGRVRAEISAKTAATKAVGNARSDLYAQLGSTLYQRGRGDPALTQAIDGVAAVDQARAATAASVQASLAATASMRRGTMAKLAGLVLGLVIVSATAIGIATRPRKAEDARGSAPIASSPRPAKAVPFRPFSADQLVTDGAERRTVKVYATERALRSEGEEDGQKFIMILRLDKQLIWTLSPETSVYTELSIDLGDRITLVDDRTVEPGCAVMGEEQIGPYRCVQEMCEVQGDGGPKHGVIRWTAWELGGIIVKQTDPFHTVELANIKLGPQDPALFEIPAGYHL